MEKSETYDFDSRSSELLFYVKSLKFFDDTNNRKSHNPYGSYISSNINNCSPDENIDMTTFLLILKSNALIMMYNFIEASIKTSIYNIYESINNSDTTFEDLTDFYKKIYTEYLYKNNAKNSSNIYDIQKILSLANDLTNDIIQKNKVEFNNDSFHLSGNADLREIRDIYKKHNIDISQSNMVQPSSPVSFEVLKIKESRNSLAHGSTTFSKTAEELSVDDIQRYSKDVIRLLRYLLKRSNDFIRMTGFKN